MKVKVNGFSVLMTFLSFLVIAVVASTFLKANNGLSKSDLILIEIVERNINSGHLFEGDLTPLATDVFYVNDDNLLQVDGLPNAVCDKFSLDGYNCYKGSLITALNIDPAIKLEATLKRVN